MSKKPERSTDWRRYRQQRPRYFPYYCVGCGEPIPLKDDLCGT